MAEVAPGLYVSPYVPQGKAFRWNLHLLGIGEGYGMAVHPTTWERLTLAQQEEIMDLYTRRHAEVGTAALENYLGGADA